MILLSMEKKCQINAQERYDIINFALEAANEDGFINQFIYERSLYLYAAILKLDISEKLREAITVNPLTAWDMAIEDGTIDKLSNNYGPDLDYLAEDAATIVDDYANYQISVRGTLANFQGVTDTMIEDAAKGYEQVKKESGLENIVDIADYWGMNNEVVEPDADSLFSN